MTGAGETLRELPPFDEIEITAKQAGSRCAARDSFRSRVSAHPEIACSARPSRRGNIYDVAVARHQDST